MTGTAETSAEEFIKVYGLDVIVIPTNKPIQRVDNQDLIFQTEKGKFQAIAKKVKELMLTNYIGEITERSDPRAYPFDHGIAKKH